MTTHTATFVVATSVRAKTCVAVVFGGASSPLGTLFSVVFDLAIDVGLPVHLNHLLGLLRRCHICASQNTFQYIAQGVPRAIPFSVCACDLPAAQLPAAVASIFSIMLPFQSMLLAKAEHPVIKFDEHIKSHHALVPFSSAPHFIVLVPSSFLLIILLPQLGAH